MGIQSTQNISRHKAIARIIRIYMAIESKDYRELEVMSFEPDYDIQEFVDGGIKIDISNIEKWTDTMIADKMDEPFFRYSMFDNYLII